jgi:hypothetical protein
VKSFHRKVLVLLQYKGVFSINIYIYGTFTLLIKTATATIAMPYLYVSLVAEPELKLMEPTTVLLTSPTDKVPFPSAWRRSHDQLLALNSLSTVSFVSISLLLEKPSWGEISKHVYWGTRPTVMKLVDWGRKLLYERGTLYPKTINY